MKSKKSLILVLTLMILLVGALFYFNRGEFEVQATTGITPNTPVKVTYLYLGHKLAWQGRMNPTITEIQLMDTTGSLIDLQQHPDLKIYLEETGNLGLISETDLKERKYDLLSPQNYKMKGENINIVIRMKADLDVVKDIDRLVITYSLLGRSKTQYMSIKLIR